MRSSCIEITHKQNLKTIRHFFFRPYNEEKKIGKSFLAIGLKDGKDIRERHKKRMIDKLTKYLAKREASIENNEGIERC